MSLPRQAARLNNEAIVALNAGNYPMTVALLGQSVKTLKQELSTSPEDPEKALKSSSTFLNFSTIELARQGKQEEIFLFNHAFQIPENEEDETASTNIHVYTAVVLFNLALAHHRQHHCEDCTVDYQKRHRCLDRAEKLYTMILRLLDKQTCQDNRSALIVKLACINNLSQIRDCYDAASDALRSLSNFVSSSGMSNDNELFREMKLQGLIMNVLMLRAPMLAPAA